VLTRQSLDRIRILGPLKRRNFALLWAGMTVSLLGDGIYYVAITWEALRLENTTVAVSLVGVAWTLPTVIFLLVGGALSDRVDRRRLMIWASLVEAAAIGGIGLLQLSGLIELWALLCLVAVYGAAQAFFLPAFEALVPTLLDPDEVTHASALDQFVRPLSIQLAGPAIGGIVIAFAGTGVAFLLDSATFLVCAGALLIMRASPGLDAVRGGAAASTRGLREAIRFVRANAWLWQTLVAAGVTLLVFFGPYQVLLPFLVKNDLHGGSGMLGAIRALGGVGALAAALTVSQSGMPGRSLSVMFGAWAVQCLGLAGYAVAQHAWMFGAISLLAGASCAVGNIVWGTLLKTRVPNRLLGRVASLDWLVSIGLVPLSFALTGPVAHLIGARATLLCGGLISTATMLSFLVLPAASRAARRRRAATRPGITVIAER
jgi:DHA3 family tetracycline resistance protein-like MFS transporter